MAAKKKTAPVVVEAPAVDVTQAVMDAAAKELKRLADIQAAQKKGFKFTRATWTQVAHPIEIDICGMHLIMEPHVYGTGTVGWQIQSCPLSHRVGDQLLPCTGKFDIMVNKSKGLLE